MDNSNDLLMFASERYLCDETDNFTLSEKNKSDGSYRFDKTQIEKQMAEAKKKLMNSKKLRIFSLTRHYLSLTFTLIMQKSFGMLFVLSISATITLLLLSMIIMNRIAGKFLIFSIAYKH